MLAYGIALKSKDCHLDNQDHLKTLITQTPKKSSLVIGLPPADIYFQKTKVDQTLSEEDICAFLNARFDALFGAPADDFYWDFEKHLNDDITIVAADKATVTHIQYISSRARRHIAAIEPLPFAMVRALIKETQQNDCYAVLADDHDFLFLVIQNAKIFHLEKIAATQLNQLYKRITLDHPCYLIYTDENTPFLVDHVTAIHMRLNLNDALSSWTYKHEH